MTSAQKRTLIIVAVFIAAALIIVPVGNPATYGRVTGSHYTFYWNMGGGEVTDSSRLWMELLAIAGIGVVSFYGARNRS